MMKVIGGLLILIAFIYVGLIVAKTLNSREISLSAVGDSVSGIKRAISYGNDPLPDIFRMLCNEYSGQAGEFFRCLSDAEYRIGETSFSSIWNDAVRTIFTDLNIIEYSELSKLGQILGRCDTATQIDALIHCEKLISTSLDQLKKELPQKRKLALGLSATAGAFVVILLI